MKLPGGASLDLSGPALVMAVVNCTGDSFYAPSRALADKALEMALAAEAEGASIVDFGGESSRPGSLYVSEEDELKRVIPVIRAYRKKSSLPVSVDTRKLAVARAALDEGADIINDISGLGDDPLMPALCAERRAAVVMMHKKGVPLTMQNEPTYGNLAEELKAWFHLAVNRALAAGVEAGKIILDPGIGFGKNLKGNLEILKNLAEICGKDYPVLVGLSRKSFIGEITGRQAGERLAGTLAANAAALAGGARIIRVHDVKEHVDLVKIIHAISAGAEK